MSKKHNDNDISPEELLRRLRENMEMEEVPQDFNIDMPDEPEFSDFPVPDTDEPNDPRAPYTDAVLNDPTDDAPGKGGAGDKLPDPEEAAGFSELDGADEGEGEDFILPDNFEIDLPEEPDLDAVPYDTADDDPLSDTAEYRSSGENGDDVGGETPFKVDAEADAEEFDDVAEADTAAFDAVSGSGADGFDTESEFETDGETPVEQAFARAMEAADTVDEPDTREIPAVDGEEAEEFDSAEPISDQAVDDLMRKYLNEGEYESISRHREDEELALHIEDAEQYVASIENAKQADEPRAPVTETEKAVQQLSEIETEGDLDEVDVNLMIAFGMEKELSEQIGADNVQTVRDAMDIDAENLDFSRGDKLSTELPDDMEFISQSQIKDVFRVYKRKQRRLIMRLFGAVLVAVAIAIFENYTFFGGSFEGTWLDPSVFPTVRSMVSLQLCFFALAFVPGALFSGFKSLFTFKPTARSVLSLMTLGTVIYHVAVCFLYDGTRVVFCTLPVAAAVVMTIISEYYALRRDVLSFRIVSSKRQKYVITEIQNDEESLERAAFNDYIDEDNTVSRVSKTSFVDGFFRRTRTSTRGIPALRAILPLPIVIAIFFFIFSAFVRRDVYLGLTSSYVAFMLAAPASVLLLYASPLYRASKIAYDGGGAIVGEDALDEYSDVAAISFEDKEVFPSAGMRIQSIKVFNNNRIDRVIYNLASLFKYLGGPLADVYSIATKDFECSDDVEIVDIADDGIEAVVSGKRIFLGREDFIVRCGFDPVYETDDSAFMNKAGRTITYLVANDQVSAKIYTQYAIDRGFVETAKQLYNAGMFLGIKTFDPGIDNDLLSGFIDLEKYPIKIIKCHSTADRTPSEDKTDSGIVSKKNSRSLLKTLALCENVNSTTKTGMFLTMASVLIAFAISAFLTFNDAVKSQYTGFLIAIYQLFWLIPTAIVSRLNIKR